MCWPQNNHRDSFAHYNSNVLCMFKGDRPDRNHQTVPTSRDDHSFPYRDIVSQGQNLPTFEQPKMSLYSLGDLSCDRHEHATDKSHQSGFSAS
jgi:hypothetical protein